MTTTAVPIIDQGERVSLGELRSRCLDREGKHRDDIVSLKSLRMDADQPGLLVVQRGKNEPSQSYEMDKHIYKQVSGVVYGLPGAYLHKIVTGDHADPELAALNFNHWVAANKDREVLLRFRRTDDGDVVRAFLPATWNPIPYASVLEVLSAKHGRDQHVSLERFNEQGLAFNLVTGKLDLQKAEKDDVVEWGMRFQDSDVGFGRLQLMPYTLTLWCLNGCTTLASGASVAVSHSGRQSDSVDEVMATVRQGMEMITGYSRTIVKHMDAASDIPIQDGQLEETYKRINKRFDVTKLEARHAREAWDEETRRPPSVLRFANSFTRAANQEELKLESRLKLQGVGGSILELTDTSYTWN